MNLTETAEIVTWPKTHYVFVERTGSIPKNATLTWQEFQQFVPQLKSKAGVTGLLSLYKMEPPVYRAGASVAATPAQLPEKLRYELFKGGKYARFVLTGPYSQLPQATARAVEIVSEKRLRVRDDYHIEHYMNDPATTPEEKLETAILFPVA
jgi:effector-binding domain-containing protein